MKRLTLATALTPALLLLCGGLARLQATDTKVTVKDGGSILIRADGLDAAQTWTVVPSELKHKKDGVLSGVQIVESGADRCAGDPKCGIDVTRPWKIVLIYDHRDVTIQSVSANKGLHFMFSRKIHFDQWKASGNTDEREFGHGDGHHISSIYVNGSATSLCAGGGRCEISLTYTTP